MTKTKIFYGNQHVDSMYCGKTRLDVIRFWIKRLVWRSMCTMALLSVIGWSMYFGSAYLPRTVYADREVIKEVKMKFEDIPMLVKICKAESGLKQFKPNGDVVRGRVNPSDIGICQINEYYNNDEARRLGYDIFTEQGNKDFAVYLFLHRGTQPWDSSKEKWNK